MPSLSIACATGPIIEFGGRMLRVSPRTIGHFAEIQAQILYMRGDPMRLARLLVDAASEEFKAAVATACLRTIRHHWSGVSSADVNRYLSSPEGMLLTVVQALGDNPVSTEWIYEQALEKFDSGEEWFYDLLWAMEVASGDSEVFQLCSIRNIKKRQVPDDYDRYGGDYGLIAAMCSKEMGFSPDQVKRMTFRQVRMSLAGVKYVSEDDRLAEVTEIKSPVNKMHKRIVDRDWTNRYTLLVDNLSNGRPLFSDVDT